MITKCQKYQENSEEDMYVDIIRALRVNGHLAKLDQGYFIIYLDHWVRKK